MKDLRTKCAEAAERNPVWVLLGPTASGKTQVSLNMAEMMADGSLEVLSVDSMQVYIGMDTGTAKISPEDRKKVRHHMIDLVEPSEYYNAARFCDEAYRVLYDILDRGRIPLLVCGTPLYLKALLWGLFDGPAADPVLREELRCEAGRKGVAFLHERLRAVDPGAAANINPNDYKRIERALEVFSITGKPISEQHAGFDGPPAIPALFVGLRWPRGLLYSRIEARVERMFRQGLVGEVEAIRHILGRQAGQAVGYKEVISYLDGRIGLQEARELVKKNTRHCAKNQIGWFRRLAVKHWVEMDQAPDMKAAAGECMSHFTIK